MDKQLYRNLEQIACRGATLGELEVEIDNRRRLLSDVEREGAWLYAWAGALVALLAILIALIVANTGRVKVSWVLGATHQSLVWIILATAILGWLLGIVTSVIFRFRTRRRNSAR